MVGSMVIGLMRAFPIFQQENASHVSKPSFSGWHQILRKGHKTCRFQPSNQNRDIQVFENHDDLRIADAFT